MTFDFINDNKFRKILERDYNELRDCYNVKASKSILILSGSIVESVLTDYFVENLPTGKTENNILRSSLADLLDLAEAADIINSKDKQLAVIIKDYRNLIHPGKEIRTKEEFDFETAKLAKILLDIILRKLRNNHLKKYGYNAEETLKKLKSDREFKDIFGMVATKLHKVERENLLFELIKIEQLLKSYFEHYKMISDYDPVNEIRDLENLEEVKPLVQELKPLLSPEVIRKELEELKDAVIKGDSLKAFSLYNLFHEELIQLDNTDQELIAIYILSLYESIFTESVILADEKTYSTVGKYIHSAKGINKLKSISEFCIVHFGGDEWQLRNEMDVYQQIFNSVNTENQEEIKASILEFLPEDKEKTLRYGLKHFYNEAVLRGIIEEKYSS
ncbi:hypothetical protein [Salegentibacter chungangensis]|uniref:DUF4145 domain-containing protein n=1 Tax=Salegentibacter chungangensis TaxID=1335724 RepID=A0ABW3NSG1_9FLAO